MGEKEGEDLSRNFSRKDIQRLCKKYGLPAHKSNFKMATSLILYLEKTNLRSRIMWEATRSDPCPSGRSELQIGAGMISTGDQKKDYRGTACHSGSGNSQHNNQDVLQNDSQNCWVVMTSEKETENADVLAQLHKDSNTGAGLPANGFSSAVPAHSTDFQFDVRSENGIQLCVDFNSDPSDWIENMKRGVHICQCHDVHRHMSQGFHEDLGHLCLNQMKSSSVVDSDKELNNGNHEDGSSPIRMGTDAQAEVSEPLVGERILKSCGDTVHSKENMGEKLAILPLRMESGRENETSGVISCERADQKVPAVSAVNVLTKSRTCNFSRKSCDPKHTGTLENQILTAGNDIFDRSSLQKINGFLNPSLKYMEPPASTSMEIHTPPFATLCRNVGPSPSRASMSMGLADQLEYTEGDHRGLPQSLLFHGNQHQLQSIEAADASRYGTCSNKSRGQVTEEQAHLATCPRESMLLSPFKKYGSLDAVHLANNVEIDNGNFLRPPVPGQGAVDVHSSMFGLEREDVLHSPGSNGVSLGLVVREQNGAGDDILTCLKELDTENRKKKPATCVGNVGISNARHGKESSECSEIDLVERTCIKLTNSESNGEHKRKRHYSSVEGQSNYVNSGSWILRKNSTKNVRSNRRRSSQFSTKKPNNVFLKEKKIVGLLELVSFWARLLHQDLPTPYETWCGRRCSEESDPCRGCGSYGQGHKSVSLRHPLDLPLPLN